MDRYIVATRSNGYYGCDSTEFLIFPEGTYDAEIDFYLNEGMHDYAESYAHVKTGWGEDFESEEDEEAYYMNATFDWREATEEEIKTEEFYQV